MPVNTDLLLFSLTRLLYSLTDTTPRFGSECEGHVKAEAEFRNTPVLSARAGQVGVNGVGCSVLIGFADINKSRTCA